jgi:type IV pilus assembly protein PilM
MISLFKPKTTPIGLDLGSGSVKLLQLDASGTAVISAGKYDLPVDLPSDGPERRAELIEGCRKLIEATQPQGRDVVVGLTDASVQYKNIRMPRMPVEELKQAIQWEANDRFPTESQPVAIQHLCAGEIRLGEETKQEILLMGVSQHVVDAQLEVVTACGLRAMAIETTPLSLARGMSRLYRREADGQAVHVVVDIGRKGSKVVILRGSTVTFYKRLDIGGLNLNRAVAEHLKITPQDAAALRRSQAEAPKAEEGSDPRLFGGTRRENVERAMFESTRPLAQELAKEIGLCLRYHAVTFRGSRPETIHLCGGEASDTNLSQVIHEQLELPVKIAQPLDGLDLSAPHLSIERRGSLGEWAVVAGLAQRGLVAASIKRSAA